MGLYSLPGPYEGMLCVIMVNATVFVSFFKNIFRSILRVFRIHLSSSTAQPASDVSQIPQDSIFEYDPIDPSDAYIQEFKNRTRSIRFDSVQSGERLNSDCTVCLTTFEPESEINRLFCGHVFHEECLEQWLGYWNIRCPLCRTPLMPEEESKYFGANKKD